MSQSWILGWLALLSLPVAVAALLSRRGAGDGIRAGRVAGSALVYAALGPPLGGALIGIPALLTHDDPEPATMLVFMLAMSYIPGLVPALVGGACMGLLRPRVGAAARVGIAALVCALAAAAFGLGVLDLPLASLPPLAGLGAASAAVLEGGWLWRERRRAVARRRDARPGAGPPSGP